MRCLCMWKTQDNLNCLNCNLIPNWRILYLLHLHQPFRIAIGLWSVWQPYPRSNALYEVSVRQARCLPPTSFRFHLAMDTLVLGYVIPAIRAHSGLTPVDNAHAERTKKKSASKVGNLMRSMPIKKQLFTFSYKLHCLNL